jgi:hypothetical protein
MSYNCDSLNACPTCGPGCNYECVDGVCEEVPRDNGGRVSFGKTRGTRLGTTGRGPRGQRQSFRSFEGGTAGMGYKLFTQQYFIGIGVGSLLGYYLLPKLLKK